MRLGILMNLTFLAALGAWTLAGCGDGETAQRARGEAPAAERDAPPSASLAFTLNDQNGKPVSLGDYAGRIVVLEWTNYDCPFVQRHYRDGTFRRLAEEFGPDGVAWLAINSTHYATVDKNKAFADQYGVTTPILDDHEGNVGRMFNARTTPHMFVLDKGHVVIYNGAIDDDPGGTKAEGERANYVRQAVEALLAGGPVLVTETKPYGCSMKYK